MNWIPLADELMSRTHDLATLPAWHRWFKTRRFKKCVADLSASLQQAFPTACLGDIDPVGRNVICRLYHRGADTLKRCA